MKIDGKQIANIILEELKTRVKNLQVKTTIPQLVIILIDKNPASLAYVNQKKIKGQIIGAKITVKYMPQDIGQSKLLKIIQQLNNDSNVHGIIVQLPLPKAIDKNKISLAIAPKKDIDGFHPESKFQPPLALAVLRILEKICYKNSPSKSDFARCQTVSGFVPPRRWPKGLLRGEFRDWLSSKKIAVIGKGETGGKPIIDTFRKIGINPTIVDSKTPNPQALTKTADIIISAVGKPNVVKPGMVKKGAILIGVGLHKGSDGKMHGDYDDEKIKNIASFYTPTPGGVGPVNVVMLLKNLVSAGVIVTHPRGVIMY